MTNSDVRKWVYAFGDGTSEGDPARKDTLGGKGASLAAMSRAGLPVPPGFTICAEACPIVEKTGAWPPGLEDQVRAALAHLEQATGRTFGHAPRPLLVAVRSGAATSMPGMMDTILNCGLNPALATAVPALRGDFADHIRMFARSVAGLSLDPDADAEALLAAYAEQVGKPFPVEPWDALAQCIHAVFASWNSPRAIAYRQHHDIRGVVGTAVNVQAMFPSERAGILFTTNPNDAEADEMLLEASWGLGEAVVSGAVTPDVYVLSGDPLAVTREVPGQRPGNEPALRRDQVLEVAAIGHEVEAHFGFPCDIEWGLADGRFALLQCRPVRGLDVLRDVEVGRQADIERLQALAGDDRVVWVEHNLAETLPTPTPLTWDIVRHFMSGAGGFGQMYRDFGYRPSAEVCHLGFLELICGRIYVDPRRAAGLFWEGIPYEYGPDEVLRDPDVLDRAPSKLDLQKAPPDFFLRVPRLLWSTVRCARVMRRARARAADVFEQQAIPCLQSFLEEAAACDLAALDTPALLAELDRRRDAFDHFGNESLKPGFFGGMAQGALLALLVQILGDDGPALASALTMGLEHDTTVEQNLLLYRVAQGEATLDEFLARYGHRAAGEMELAQPRWSEDPSYLERIVESYRLPGVVPPAERHEQQAAARRRAEHDLPDRLADSGGASLLERIQAELADAQRLLPYRETGKHHLMRAYATIRDALLELARRWDLGRDLFFLRLAELPRFEAEADDLREAIAARRLRWKSSQRLAPARTIDSNDLDDLGRPRPHDEGEALEGSPLAAGSARGPARVVLDPQQAGDLGTGYILVCPSTDPGWTPLFVNARGLVVERGGILSHGAIVARDFGIPAVACEGATQRIPDGATVAIDGATGTIALSGVRS